MAVAFELELESLLKVPREGVAVDRAAGADPLVGRALVVGAPYAVVVGAYEIEDHAVGVKLGIVVAAGVVVEGDAEDVSGEDFLSALAAAGVRAVLVGDGLERPAYGVAMAGFDLLAELRIGERPQCADGLVGAEGEVESGGTVLESRVPRQRCLIVGGETGVEGLKIVGVDGCAVFQPEQSAWVPPHSVRLVASAVVVKRRPVAFAVPQVVGRARRLAECLHVTLSQRRRA